MGASPHNLISPFVNPQFINAVLRWSSLREVIDFDSMDALGMSYRLTRPWIPQDGLNATGDFVLAESADIQGVGGGTCSGSMRSVLPRHTAHTCGTSAYVTLSGDHRFPAPLPSHLTKDKMRVCAAPPMHPTPPPPPPAV